MGGAPPLATAMNGGVAICIEVDPSGCSDWIDRRYLDQVASDLDSALQEAEGARCASPNLR